MEPNSIHCWEATAVDGTELNSHQARTYERVNDRGGGRSLRVWIVGRDQPIHAACTPDHGESLHLFTRRGILNACTADARQVDMPVIEMRRRDGSFVRTYVHPDHGIIVSSLDLNL